MAEAPKAQIRGVGSSAYTPEQLKAAIEKAQQEPESEEKAQKLALLKSLASDEQVA